MTKNKKKLKEIPEEEKKDQWFIDNCERLFNEVVSIHEGTIHSENPRVLLFHVQQFLMDNNFHFWCRPQWHSEDNGKKRSIVYYGEFKNMNNNQEVYTKTNIFFRTSDECMLYMCRYSLNQLQASKKPSTNDSDVHKHEGMVVQP